MNAKTFAIIHRVAERVSSLLDRQRVRFVCATVIVMAAVMLAVGFVTAEQGQTVFGPQLGADYAQFYVAGTLLNSTRPARLYDLSLQDKIYHQQFPTVPQGISLPCLHAPFFAVLMRPFALLPYKWSYGVWLIVGMALYTAGLRLLWRSTQLGPEYDFPTTWLVSVSFLPLLAVSWMGGQSSAVGFFSICMASFLQRRGNAFLGGVVLSLCLYKPTLPALVLPLLVVGRRYRMLTGFATGASCLAGVSVLAVGFEGCRRYVEVLLDYARFRQSAPTAFRPWMYVDALSLTRSINGASRWWGSALLAALMGAVLILLIRVWWRSERGWSDSYQLSWSCAWTWTPLLSGYFGMYDTVVIIPAVLLGADVLTRAAPQFSPEAGKAALKSLPAPFQSLLALVYVSAWFSQPVARLCGFQPYTVALAALAAYLLFVATSARRTRPCAPVSR